MGAFVGLDSSAHTSVLCICSHVVRLFAQIYKALTSDVESNATGVAFNFLAGFPRNAVYLDLGSVTTFPP